MQKAAGNAGITWPFSRSSASYLSGTPVFSHLDENQDLFVNISEKFPLATGTVLLLVHDFQLRMLNKR